MEISVWFTFIAASTLLLLIPGPTILLVLSYALSQGRRVALATAAGVALGDLLAMTASLLGLGALVLASAELFTLLKWVGAIYLVYLGLKLLRTPPAINALDEGHPTTTSARGVFLHAAAVTALNPKSIAFFIAFVPQFISPNTSLAPQFGILIATFVGLATLNALAYALLADRLRLRITKPSVLVWLSRMGGGALIAMGVMTAALRKTT